MKCFVFSFLLMTFFASCKKEDANNQIPEPSSSGKNFLACKVNGVVHRYTVEDALGRNGVGYRRFVDQIEVGASEADYKDAIGITVALPPDSVLPSLVYQLSQETGKSFSEYYKYQAGGGPTLTYFTTAGSGWIKFSRVDTLVGSGTFAFTAYIDGQQGKDSVVITEGVFDIAR